MRTRLKTLLAVAGFLVAAPTLHAQRGSTGSYQIVVSASNPLSTLDARDVSRMFRKDITRWPDGSPVTPVDQKPDSPTRLAFSASVHGRSPALIAEFWRQQIFSGRSVPPAEKSTDAEVLDFIRANPGSIGYVSGQTAIGPDVKVITLSHAAR